MADEPKLRRRVELCAHLLERMQERGITREQVFEALLDPDVTYSAKGKSKRIIVHKTLAQGTLKLVYKPKKDRFLVITAVWIGR